MKILITGGAGYIGSITNRLLREAGHETVVFDNLSVGHEASISGTKLVRGDLRDKNVIAEAVKGRGFEAVIHFAALALAGESMARPYQYYENNILGGLNLLEAMREAGIGKIVFSSTCAVYGYPKNLPVTETESFKPVSVYGSSKRMFEEVLDWYSAVYQIRHVKLRYFNAAGAWPDGSLGEDHRPETHIIPIAVKAAMEERPFYLFGDDYQTPDGTCIRDYIHVSDLAEAHRLALEHLTLAKDSTFINLGVGKGYSNLEVIRAIEDVSGVKITIEKKSRRPGDPDAIFADNTKAREILSWQPKYPDLYSIVRSAWEWHRKNPGGYR
jgi:UDP-glucose 4-epimerase